jgi:integral membrane sensor domain MASE1
METKQHFPLTSNFVVAERNETSTAKKRLRTIWLTALGVCGISGLMSGITGLTLSLLTALGVVARTRTVSIAVSVLIVAALGLLLTAAHAMDRTDGVS